VQKDPPCHHTVASFTITTDCPCKQHHYSPWAPLGGSQGFPWPLLAAALVLRAHCVVPLRPGWIGPADASSPVDGIVVSRAHLQCHKITVQDHETQLKGDTMTSLFILLNC
jgi:hypothetical protein